MDTTESERLEAFFSEYFRSRIIYNALVCFIETLGPFKMKVMKSQIVFYNRKSFARVWIPGKYLQGSHAPLVITFSFDFKDVSGRWKEIVEPKPGIFTHHLELFSKSNIDSQVQQWLRYARNKAA